MEVAFVNNKKCNACGKCVSACDYGAMQIAFDDAIGDGRATVETDRCTGCAACLLSCPRNALTLISEDNLSS